MPGPQRNPLRADTRGWLRTQFNQYLSLPHETVLALPPELQTDLGYHHSKSVPGWIQGGLGGVDTQDALTYIGRMKERGGDGSQPSLGAESAKPTDPTDSFRRPSIHDGKDKVKAKL